MPYELYGGRGTYTPPLTQTQKQTQGPPLTLLPLADVTAPPLFGYLFSAFSYRLANALGYRRAYDYRYVTNELHGQAYDTFIYPAQFVNLPRRHPVLSSMIPIAQPGFNYGETL